MAVAAMQGADQHSREPVALPGSGTAVAVCGNMWHVRGISWHPLGSSETYNMYNILHSNLRYETDINIYLDNIKCKTKKKCAKLGNLKCVNK